MTNQRPLLGSYVIIQKENLQYVFDALIKAGYVLVGPTMQEEAIVYEQIEHIEEMPIGWLDEQGPGLYRLSREDGRSFFGYVVGPQSWKRYLYPPSLPLFKSQSNGDGFEIETNPENTSYAFIGARSCELAAVQVQDRIFLEGSYQEPHYKERREGAFFLAVNCGRPAETCFCTSMGTGPRCQSGFDLALTELENQFLVEVGSERGAEMLTESEWRLAGAFELDSANRLLEKAAQNMGRSLDTQDLPDLLYDNLDHARWDHTAARCLSCMNCTMVCPTCFCVDVVDGSDLSGKSTERTRVWDSCFNPDFSYVHGGNIRPNIRARYRQWLTHKLASWSNQFGTSGCVGCGRCITWCPVGIDLTEEIAEIRGETKK